MGLSHTVSGDIASFRTPSRVPIESLKFHFLPKQAAGTPTPEDPIPIEGWTGLNGFGANENLISLQDLTLVNQSADINTIVDGGDLKLTVIKNTTTWAGASQDAYYNVPPALRGKEIFICVESIALETVNKDNQRTTVVCEFRDVNNAFITDPTVVSYTIDGSSAVLGRKITVPSNAYIMKLYFRIAQNIRDYGVYIGDYIIFHNFCIKYQDNHLGFKQQNAIKLPITFPSNGKNLFNKNDPTSIVTGLNVEKGSLSYYHFSGSSNSTVVYIPCVPGKTYTVSKIATARSAVCYLKNNDIPANGIEVFGYLNFNDQTSKTITVGNDATYLVVYITNRTYDDTPLQTVLDSLQIELGDTATSYEPYSSDNTFYGGYIDPVAGEIVETYKKIFLKEKSWYRYTSNQFASNIGKVLTSASLFCDSLPISTTNGYPTVDKSIGFYSNGQSYCNIVFIRYNDSDNAQDFTDWLNGLEHDPYIVYEYNTPIHIPIPAEDLKAFLDHNNFWSDANDITEVTYAVTESKDILDARKLIMDGSQPHLEDASGTIASFSTDIKAPVKELKAYFTPVQEGSGDASPQNIRSIVGRKGVNLMKTLGKNLLKPGTFSRETNGITFTYNSDGSVDISGSNPSGYSFMGLPSSFEFYLPPGTYTLSGSATGITVYILMNGIDIEFKCSPSMTKKTVTLTTGGMAKLQVAAMGTFDTTIYPQLELGSSKTAFESPEDHAIIPIEFPAMRNLLDTSTHETDIHITRKGITFDYNSDGTLTVNGQVESGVTSGPQYRIAQWTQQETGDYYLCCGAPYSTAYNETYVWDNGLSERPKKWDESTASQSAASNRPLSEVHLIAGHTYSINIRINRDQDKTYVNDNFYVMLLRSTDTDTHYEPYGTVYGGYVDLVRSKIVATHAKCSFTFGTSGADLENVTRRYFALPIQFMPANYLHYNGQGEHYKRTMCNIAKWGWDYYGDYVHYYIEGSQSWVFLPIGTPSDTVVELCAELATPIEYDLTPQQLKTLKGLNNIWSDTNGNVDVKYWTH